MEVLQIVIPSVVSMLSVVLSYVFGRLQSDYVSKREVLQKTYTSWSLPFIGLLYESLIWKVGFSGLLPDHQRQFVGLIVKNIQYMDTDTLDCVDVFLECFYLNALDKIPELTSDNGVVSDAKLDEAFDDLTLHALAHSQKLAQQLKQPELGAHVRELYLEAQANREK